MTKLSPSGLLKYLDCPRAYYYQYVEKLRPQVQSSNLHFGTSVHQAITAWLTGAAADPVTFFLESWREVTGTIALDYNAKWSPESLEATAKALLKQFPAVWDESGIMPLIDEEGQLVLERPLLAKLTPDIILSGQPDLIGMTIEAAIVVIDFKTAASPVPEGFAGVSDQLLAYQVLAEAHADLLGINRVDHLGFFELIKRQVPNGKSKGKGPEVLPPVLARRADTREFIRKAIWVASNIEAGNFFPNPRMAWNTPCGLCDFKLLCYTGSYEGLRQPAIYD